MKRGKRTPTWRPSAAASCLAVVACTAMPLPPIEPPAPTVAGAPARLAQRGHGGEAVFALCSGESCPRRTPKTLAQAPTAAPSTALTAPAAPSTQVDTTVGPDERALPPSTPARAMAPALPTFEQVSVHFPFASAQLGAAARAVLREAAPRLGQASEITLSGRTDNTGPTAANDVLAKARAQAVLRELLALAPAIAPHVSVDGQGACCYAEPNDSPAGRASNRRVEIRYRIDGDDPP